MIPGIKHGIYYYYEARGRAIKLAIDRSTHI
jgi:hypothetical protein